MLRIEIEIHHPHDAASDAASAVDALPDAAIAAEGAQASLLGENAAEGEPRNRLEKKENQITTTNNK